MKSSDAQVHAVKQVSFKCLTDVARVSERLKRAADKEFQTTAVKTAKFFLRRTDFRRALFRRRIVSATSRPQDVSAKTPCDVLLGHRLGMRLHFVNV